jgi:hypothetical protein
MLLALATLFGLVMAVLAGPVSQWLLNDRAFVLLIALSGFAVAAAMITDLLSGTLSAAKEIGLIGISTMLSTVLGLAVFAPCAYVWGVSGGLWASFAVLIVSALVSAIVVARRSRGVPLSDFLGPFDSTECRRLFGFYPMLLVNGALAPLTLILVRDALVAALGLDAAGLWQATWRLSEAYQAVIVSSTALYFIPSLGERLRDPPALRRQVLRTRALTAGATALLALPIGLLRNPSCGSFSAEVSSRRRDDAAAARRRRAEDGGLGLRHDTRRHHADPPVHCAHDPVDAELRRAHPHARAGGRHRRGTLGLCRHRPPAGHVRRAGAARPARSSPGRRQRRPSRTMTAPATFAPSRPASARPRSGSWPWRRSWACAPAHSAPASRWRCSRRCSRCRSSCATTAPAWC